LSLPISTIFQFRCFLIFKCLLHHIRIGYYPVLILSLHVYLTFFCDYL